MVLKKLFRALSGVRVWKRLKNKDTLFIIFPEYSDKYTKCGARYSESYADNKDYKSIVFVTSDEKIVGVLNKLNIDPSRTELLKVKDMNRLLSYFSMHITFMGFSIFENVKFISESYIAGRAFKALCDADVYSPEFIVEKRMYH